MTNQAPFPSEPVHGDSSLKRHMPLIAVAHIGNHHMPGVLDAAGEAQAYAWARGYRVEVFTIKDLTIWNRFGIGAMRNMGVLVGYQDYAADFCVVLDNDVKLRPDTLWRLAERNKPVISPYFECDEFLPPGEPVPVMSKPSPANGQALVMMNWVVGSCLMFSRLAVKAIGGQPFAPLKIANIDEYDCRIWQFAGCDVWMDTNASVDLLQAPGSRRFAETAPPLKTPEQWSPMPGEPGWEEW